MTIEPPTQARMRLRGSAMTTVVHTDGSTSYLAPAPGTPARPGATPARKGLLAAGAVVCVLAVAAPIVAVASDGDDKGTRPAEPAPATSTSHQEETAAVPAKSVGASVVVTQIPQRITAAATGGTRTVTLRVRARRVPDRAVVTLDPAGPGKPITRTVRLRAKTTTVTLDGLAAGTARWWVRVEGARTVKGAVQVKAPVVYVPPADSTESPSYSPPSSPAPAPSPKPSPKPAGPATPYDPDEHR